MAPREELKEVASFEVSGQTLTLYGPKYKRQVKHPLLGPDGVTLETAQRRVGKWLKDLSDKTALVSPGVTTPDEDWLERTRSKYLDLQVALRGEGA